VKLSAPVRPRAASAEHRRPSRTQRRFARRLRARRWRAWRRVLVLVGVTAVVAGLGWLVFFSSLLAVHQVSVTGTEVLSEEEVAAQADVAYDVPLATSDLAAVEARVEALAPVASVEVSRDWPDGVHVAVTERVAVAAVPWEGAWRGVDSDGVLFRDYAERPELPLIVASATTPASALAEAAAVVQGLPADLVDRIDSVEVGSIDDITLLLRGGVEVRWGSADEGDRKEQVLALLMREPAEVYDVTAPGRPTIRR
jgi:cell division protein FtsQ